MEPIVLLLTILATGMAAVTAIPVLVLAVEIVAAIANRRPFTSDLRELNGKTTLAVVIPAHNEGMGMSPTLEDVARELRPCDRLLVVADNCVDDTAAVAQKAGATVVVRSDLTKIGKGYALDYGLKTLSPSPPDIVIIIDADCRLAEGGLRQLAAQCANLGRPIQALYLMTAPTGAAINYQVAEFAWRVKNWVRPLGLSKLNLPCQLMGSGMAFPWRALQMTSLASGAIVEDLKLGLELATVKFPAFFFPGAVVRSTFPISSVGAQVQRQRWEQGHLGIIWTKTPSLLFQALKQKRLDLLFLTLDLVVPPVSLLGLLAFASVVCSALATFMGASTLVLWVSAVVVALFLLALITAWIRFGRDVLPARALALIPVYLVAKMKLYAGLLIGRRVRAWIRTERN